jgi:hypothetical protein
LIVLGLYVGLQTDVLSNNFANMWEASKTVVNPDGTVTVTKLAGMAILGAAGATIINSLFLVMLGMTLLLEKLKNLKEYSSVSWNLDCNCYLCFS